MDLLSGARESTVHRAVVLLAGVLIGSLMITPGVAHISDSLAHLQSHLDQRYLRPRGSIQISTAPQDWVDFALSDHVVDYSGNITTLSAGGSPRTDQFAILGAKAPVALYGKRTRLLGMELCYDTAGGAVLDSVLLQVFRNTVSGHDSTPEASVVDDTDRTDDACRAYELPSPFGLTGDDFVSVAVQVDYPAGSSFMELGRTTFELKATKMPAAAG